MVVPTLLYGNETWVPTLEDLNKTESTEIKFLRNVKLCSILDKMKNAGIREELEIESITNKRI